MKENQTDVLEQHIQVTKEMIDLLSQPFKLAYTANQLVEILEMDINKINLLRQLGALKAIKKGTGYIFPKKEVEVFLNDFIGMDLSNINTIRESIAEVRKKAPSFDGKR